MGRGGGVEGADLEALGVEAEEDGAAEREGRVAALHVPLHAHRVRSLGDRVHLQRQIGQQLLRKRQSVEQPAADEGWMEAQSTHEGLLATADGGGA